MRDESSPLLSSSINEEYWSAPGGLVATAAVLIITSILFGAFGYSLIGIVACIPLYFVWRFRIFKKIFHFMWEFVVSLSRYSQLVNLLKQNVLKLDTTIVFVGCESSPISRNVRSSVS